jgi:hypothetical protein
MTKLTDMQLVLLTTAAGRPDGSLLPPADSLGTRGDRIRRSVAALVNKALAAETPVKDKRRSWREDGGQLYGVAITEAGRTAIGVAPQVATAAALAEPAISAVSAEGPVATPPSTPRPETKIAGVLALLQRPEGATLPELIAVTHWLPHTTRAALTNLRKKGHLIARGKRAGATCYTLPEAG